MSFANIASVSLYFLRGGFVYAGLLYNAANFGYSWSSTANSATNAYRLVFADGKVYPSYNGNRGNRYDGLSIRCVNH